MTLPDALWHPNTLIAMIAYFVSAILLLALTAAIAQRVENIPASHWWYKAFSHWYVEHIWIPLARVLSLAIFIALAYPAMFGLNDPPSIISLLASDNRVSTLVNTLFLTGLLLPLAPVIGSLHVLVLPVQGIAATLLVFSWLLPVFGTPPVDYWPDGKTLILLILFTMISHWPAVKVADTLGEKLDDWFNRDGFPAVLYQLGLLVFQAPIILSYSLYLGRQL